MSEPERIGEFLPEVLQNIERCCKLNLDNKAFNPTAKNHTERAFSATCDFMKGWKPGRRAKRRPKQKALF